MTSARARSRPGSGKRSSTLVSQYPPSPNSPEICQYPYSEHVISAPAVQRSRVTAVPADRRDR